MNTNTKFPNHHFISSNKFGFVLPQIREVIKPSQVPIEEKKKEESPLTEDNDNFTVYADMSFYSAEDLVKYETVQSKTSQQCQSLQEFLTYTGI